MPKKSELQCHSHSSAVAEQKYSNMMEHSHVAGHALIVGHSMFIRTVNVVHQQLFKLENSPGPIPWRRKEQKMMLETSLKTLLMALMTLTLNLTPTLTLTLTDDIAD